MSVCSIARDWVGQGCDLALAALALCGPSLAQVTETQQVIYDGLNAGIVFDVDIHDDLLVISRISGLYDSYIGIWERTMHGFEQIARVRHDGDTTGGFGRRVELHGDTLAIGSSDHDGNTGVVHTIARGPSGWPSYVTPNDRIASPFGAPGFFGWDIAVNERWLAVSALLAPGHGHGGTGAVVMYEKVGDDFEPFARIGPPASQVSEGGMRFGHDTAIDGGTLVVSNDSSQRWDGAAHIYEYHATTGWTWIATISDPDPRHPGDQFGHSVAVAGDTIVIGEQREVTFPYVTGLAHIVERDTAGRWTYVRSIEASNGAADGSGGDLFGAHVATDGNTIVVGAPRAVGVNGQLGDGALYVFRRRPDGTWGATEDEILLPSLAGQRIFGASMDASNGAVLAAGLSSPWLPGPTWTAYLFTPGAGVDVCDGDTTPNPAAAHLDVMSDDPSEPGVALWGAAPGTAYVVAAAASHSAGTSIGTCLGGPLLRVATGTFDVGGGPVLIDPEITRIAALGPGGWTEPLFLQAWCRAPTGETAWTRAVRIQAR